MTAEQNEEKPSPRKIARAYIDAKVEQAKALTGKSLRVVGKAGKFVGRVAVEGAKSTFYLAEHRMFTVDDLVVTLKILPPGHQERLIKKPKTVRTTTSQLEDQIGGKESSLKKFTGGRVGTDRTPIERERFGLPIVIQFPIDVDPKSALLKGKGQVFSGRTVLGADGVSRDSKNGPKTGVREIVGYMEVAPITPESNYLHTLNVGVAWVNLNDRSQLHPISTTSVRTINTANTREAGINLAQENITADDLAEAIVDWLCKGDISVNKDHLFSAFQVAARLNIGVEDFWKTVHARKYFELLQGSHPEAIVLAMNTFLSSNKPKEALGSLYEFYNKITRQELPSYEEFVVAAREAVAGLPEDTVLMVNLGMGPLQRLMNLTTKSILNREQAQNAVVEASGLDPDENTNEFQLLTTGDPLSVILLSPRLLSGIVKFVVERYIPLQEAIIDSNLKAVEQGLITAKAGSDAVAAFQVRIRKSFEEELPKIYNEIDAKGPRVAQELADRVTGMLNASVEEVFSVRPGLTYVKDEKVPAIDVTKNLVSGKLEKLKAKVANSNGTPSGPKKNP